MLCNLSIQNYALIDNIQIPLSKGFTTITGETGAGKSILLGALGLLLGQRADTQVLSNKDRKCVIEGEFSIAHYKLKDFFTNHDLDYNDQTIIRREINPAGNSRAFINDTPVNLQVLKEISGFLVDIHSQHQTLSLGDASYQLSILDAVAGHNELLLTYKKTYSLFREKKELLEKIKNEQIAASKELDYLQFQFNELSEAKLTVDEQSLMEQELDTLSNSETIKLNLAKAVAILSDGEQNLIQSFAEVKNLTGSVSKYNEGITAISERINSSYIELKDISSELEDLATNIHHDPARIEFINARLDLIYRLEKKHQVNSVKELLEIMDALDLKLSNITGGDERIDNLRKELEGIKENLDKVALKLSSQRKKNIPAIEKDLVEKLQGLGMPGATVRINSEILEEPGANGIDKVKILFSANRGSEPKELQKVASGGELSRVMLSVKAIIAKSISLPTIVFDEIDTGVSGDVADKMGHIMKEMSKGMQVISITHLPQIASKGNNHLFVYKMEEKERTATNIKVLANDERIVEIAKMLSTGTPTNAALKNARELLNA